jgi:hypothetical protein
VITFIAHLNVRPEDEAAFKALMTHVRDVTRAHAAHRQTPWVIESIPQSRRLVEGKFDIKQYVSPGVEPAVRRLKET